MGMMLKQQKPVEPVDIMAKYLEIVEANPTWHVYVDDFGEQGVFIYKALGRKDFRDIVSYDTLSDTEKEEVICDTCVLYPENIDFGNYEYGGLPTTLARRIMDNSLVTNPDAIRNMVYHFRNEIYNDYEKLQTLMIHEAFPEYKIDGPDGIENWDLARRAEFTALAEVTLHTLRGIPLAEIGTADSSEQQSANRSSGSTRMIDNSDGSKTRVTTKTISAPPKTNASKTSSSKKPDPETIARMNQIAPGYDWSKSATYETLTEQVRSKALNWSGESAATIDWNKANVPNQNDIPEALRDKFRVLSDEEADELRRKHSQEQ